MNPDLLCPSIEKLHLMPDSSQLRRRYPSLKHDSSSSSKATPYLCETCTSFFPENIPDEGQPLPVSWPDLHGSVKKERYEVATSMRKCSFCTLLYSNFLDLGRDHENEDDFAPFTIEVEKSGIRPARRKSGPRAYNIQVKSLAIHTRTHRGQTLRLRPCLNPVPSVDSYCASKKPLLAHSWKSRLSQRLVDEKADIRLLQRWTWLCREAHGERCDQPHWLAIHEYPSRLRLIDIINMVVVEANPQQRYIALSYVWGQAKSTAASLTSRNVHKMKRPGSSVLSSLPQTFNDVIELTRLLGESHVWIDALCIVQDDPYDLEHQIAQMDLIYSRSVLTIVAGSGDVHSGLPHIFKSSRKLRQDYLAVNEGLCLMEDHTRGIFGPDDSPWLFRGWTYQENVLPRRCLFFFHDQIHWRCESDYWCETVALEPCQRSLSACQYPLGLSLGIVHAENRFDLSNLTHHVFQYNVHREFTDEADSISAIQGVLNRISYVSKVIFHWGLPTRHFAHALLWRDELRSRRENKRRRCVVKPPGQVGSLTEIAIPSWSWQGWRTGLAKAPPYQYQVSSLALEYEQQQPRTTSAWRFDWPPDYIWTSSWYRVDVTGRLSNLETGSNSSGSDGELNDTDDLGSDDIKVKKQKRISARLPWLGTSSFANVTPYSGRFVDSGMIVAWTSYSSFKIRSTHTTWLSILKGNASIDDLNYNVFNDDAEVIGMMRAVDVVLPQPRMWSYNTFIEVAELKTYHFIVISAENGCLFEDRDGESASEEESDMKHDTAHQILINNMLGRRDNNEKLSALRELRTRQAFSDMVYRRENFQHVFNFDDTGDQSGHQILPRMELNGCIPPEVHNRVELHVQKRKRQTRSRRTLNLMMIDFDDTANPNTASRLGLFQLDENLWMKVKPEWKLITLH